MFAPLPKLPVFTLERRIVNADVPRFFEPVERGLIALFSTFLAVAAGGGGEGAGGNGSGILGDEHIVISRLVYFRFESYFGLTENGQPSVARDKTQGSSVEHQARSHPGVETLLQAA